MTRWLCVLTAVFPALCFAGNLTITSSELGENYQFSTVTAKINLRNESDQLLKISEIAALDPSDKIISPIPSSLAPHASAMVEVRIATRNDVGNRWHVLRVHTDEKENNEYLVRVHNFGLSVLDEVKPLVDFGVVDASAESAARSITLSSREDPAFRLLRVESVPDFLTARIEPDGKSLNIMLRKDVTWGRHAGSVHMKIQSSVQSEVWVEVRADVHGAVVPDANPFDFGLVRQGERNESLLRLSDRTGKALRLGKVTLDGFKGNVSQRPCLPVSISCKLLALEVSSDQATGKQLGHVLVELPEYDNRVLSIDVWGMLLKKDTKVVSLDELEKKRQSSPMKPTKKAVDVQAALKSAVAPERPASAAVNESIPPGTGPLLKWSVLNESGIYGYVIYRSDSEHGPSRKMDSKVIRVDSAAAEDGPSTYAWRDNSAGAGRTYWYSIATIYIDGHKQMLSSPQRVVAKQ